MIHQYPHVHPIFVSYPVCPSDKIRAKPPIIKDTHRFSSHLISSPTKIHRNYSSQPMSHSLYRGDCFPWLEGDCLPCLKMLKHTNRWLGWMGWRWGRPVDKSWPDKQRRWPGNSISIQHQHSANSQGNQSRKQPQQVGKQTQQTAAITVPANRQ